MRSSPRLCTAVPALTSLKDAARDMSAPEYVRQDATEAIALVQRANRASHAWRHHSCSRCHRLISEAEYLGSMDRFGRAYCRHCFDEAGLEARNFESTVDRAKRRRSTAGTAVQSRGELRIAAWLEARKLEYVYDERYRVAGDLLVRPDFYLPEYDLYIEYWGMDTPEYIFNMKKKKLLYQREGKKLISISFRDFDRIEALLEEKLSHHLVLYPGRTFKLQPESPPTDLPPTPVSPFSSSALPSPLTFSSSALPSPSAPDSFASFAPSAAGDSPSACGGASTSFAPSSAGHSPSSFGGASASFAPSSAGHSPSSFGGASASAGGRCGADGASDSE